MKSSLSDSAIEVHERVDGLVEVIVVRCEGSPRSSDLSPSTMSPRKRNMAGVQLFSEWPQASRSSYRASSELLFGMRSMRK